MRQMLRCRFAARVVIFANREQAGVFALRAGVRLQRDRREAGDLGEPVSELVAHLAVADRLFVGRKRMQFANSGHETGNISAVAFSFIVHEPSGIIEVVSERSRDSSRRR